MARLIRRGAAKIPTAGMFALYAVLLLGCASALSELVIHVEQMKTAFMQGQRRPVWARVERAQPVFVVQNHELAQLPQEYVQMRQSRSGARQDMLTYGEADADTPYVGMMLIRPAEKDMVAKPLVELAFYPSLEKGQHFTERADAGKVATKFGDIEVIEARLALKSRHRQCLAFGWTPDVSRTRVMGWFCNAGLQPVDRLKFACMINRLTLLSSGGDPHLAQAFAAAELRRGDCAAAPRPVVAEPVEAVFSSGEEDAVPLRLSLREHDHGSLSIVPVSTQENRQDLAE